MTNCCSRRCVTFQHGNNHCSQPLKVFVNVDSYSVCWTTPTGKSSSVTAAGVKSITNRTQNC